MNDIDTLHAMAEGRLGSAEAQEAARTLLIAMNGDDPDEL